MSTAVASRISASFPIPEFGQSADGLTVARIGDAAYAMIPKRDGGYFLGSGWRLSKPFADWKRSDFYGHGGDTADETAFRAFVQEQAEHQCEKAALGRQEFRAYANTPWGPSQGAVRYGEGVVFHSTSGHGGFHLSAERNAKTTSRSSTKPRSRRPWGRRLCPSRPCDASSTRTCGSWTAPPSLSAATTKCRSSSSISRRQGTSSKRSAARGWGRASAKK